MTAYKILAALSSFKGTLTAYEASHLVQDSLTKLGFQCLLFPVADGGYGTLSLLERSQGGEKENLPTVDPLFRPKGATVLCVPNKQSPHTVFIESTEACGYTLVQPSPDTAKRASTFGLGQLIDEVCEKWEPTLKRIVVTLGDSSVSDAGLGMLQALGGQAKKNGHLLSPDENPLWQLDDFEWKPFRGPALTVLCDVQNPIAGEGGAIQFALQKGFSPAELPTLKNRFDFFASLTAQVTERKIADLPRGGSAGGLGAAFSAFLGAELVDGAYFLLDYSGFSEALRGVDLVVTGEGKTDAQTLKGKVVSQVLKRADELNKKSVILSGQLGQGLEALPFHSLVGTFACDAASTPEESLAQTTLRLFSDPSVLDKLRPS